MSPLAPDVVVVRTRMVGLRIFLRLVGATVDIPPGRGAMERLRGVR